MQAIKKKSSTKIRNRTLSGHAGHPVVGNVLALTHVLSNQIGRAFDSQIEGRFGLITGRGSQSRSTISWRGRLNRPHLRRRAVRVFEGVDVLSRHAACDRERRIACLTYQTKRDLSPLLAEDHTNS